MNKRNGSLLFFFFKDTATTEIYTVYNTLSLHDALPISSRGTRCGRRGDWPTARRSRSEEHTSELQSLYTISYAVFCLKKKKKKNDKIIYRNILKTKKRNKKN